MQLHPMCTSGIALVDALKQKFSDFLKEMVNKK